MNDWFTPEAGRMFSLLSLLSLVALVSPWVQQGRHRSFVVGIYIACLSLGLGLLAGSAVAWSVGQPAHVIWPLFLSGIVISSVFAGTFRGILTSYEAAENRKIVARDI